MRRRMKPFWPLRVSHQLAGSWPEVFAEHEFQVEPKPSHSPELVAEASDFLSVDLSPKPLDPEYFGAWCQKGNARIHIASLSCANRTSPAYSVIEVGNGPQQLEDEAISLLERNGAQIMTPDEIDEFYGSITRPPPD